MSDFIESKNFLSRTRNIQDQLGTIDKWSTAPSSSQIIDFYLVLHRKSGDFNVRWSPIEKAILLTTTLYIIIIILFLYLFVYLYT